MISARTGMSSYRVGSSIRALGSRGGRASNSRAAVDRSGGQVLDRGEDSVGNDIALDLGEPVFYLIDPGGVGRGVVKMDFIVSREELLNPSGLVGREVVGNEMNLLAARLIGDQLGEEGHELLAGVTRGGFAHHRAVASVKRGV
jgi:hypothetical protein